jgi:acetylornithine deacetylase/succinyl-diaminopimelate desuccinylase
MPFRGDHAGVRFAAMNELAQKNRDLIRNHIADIDVIAMTSDMVKIPSCSMTEFHETEMVRYIKDYLQKEGIQSEIQEALPGRHNLIAILKGSGDGLSLMLCGHMDTVPAYDMKDHLSGSVRDGRLHGRGACDMKGPLAAMLAAFVGVKRSGLTLKGDLVFAAVIDEEETGKGVEYLAKNGPFVDAAVIGEPTNMRLAVGHKGLEWIRIEVAGKKVHGGRMSEGINAIAMASRLIEKIYRDYVPVLDKREHPILGKPTINVGRIEGGDQPSTVAGSCSLSIDRRRVPEETLEQVYDELSALITDLHHEDPRFNAEIKSYFHPELLMAHNPFCTDEEEPVVVSAKKVMQEMEMENLDSTFFPAWTDAGILAGFTQARCIVVGPGDLAYAHTPDEFIETAQLGQAAQFYGELALEYCSKKR